jgi:hypothetical protein
MKHRRSFGSEENLSAATGMMMFDNVKFVFLVKIGRWERSRWRRTGRWERSRWRRKMRMDEWSRWRL